MAQEAQPATRERRFKKIFLDSDSNHLDADEYGSATQLGIEVDGELLTFDVDFDEQTILRLMLDGLYDRLTRAVHSAKPAASTRDEATRVITEAYDKIKEGDFKRERKAGISAPRPFDPARFKTCLYAMAKRLGQTVSEEKYNRLLAQLTGMGGKDRQAFIQKNFMRNIHFKEAWNAATIAEQKAKRKHEPVTDVVLELLAA
jgi:hypothetical protein